MAHRKINWFPPSSPAVTGGVPHGICTFERLRVVWPNEREGYHESRRCSRGTYPESYTTKYTSIRRKNHCVSVGTLPCAKRLRGPYRDGPASGENISRYVDLGYWAISGSIHPKGDPASWGISSSVFRAEGCRLAVQDQENTCTR